MRAILTRYVEMIAGSVFCLVLHNNFVLGKGSLLAHCIIFGEGHSSSSFWILPLESLGCVLVNHARTYVINLGRIAASAASSLNFAISLCNKCSLLPFQMLFHLLDQIGDLFFLVEVFLGNYRNLWWFLEALIFVRSRNTYRSLDNFGSHGSNSNILLLFFWLNTTLLTFVSFQIFFFRYFIFTIGLFLSFWRFWQPCCRLRS